MRFRPEGLIADRRRQLEFHDDRRRARRTAGQTAASQGGGDRMTTTTAPTPAHGRRRSVLDATGVTMRFGGLTARSATSTSTVNEGEIVGLIGPNGAGKTTFFNCLTGLYVPTEGTVALQGQRPAAQAPPGHRGGHRPHLPEHPAVRQHDRPGERPRRAPHPDQGEPLSALLRGPGFKRSEAEAPRAQPGNSSSSSASAGSPTTSPATCPTATSASSRSPAPWPATRGSSSSTSPPPA